VWDYPHVDEGPYVNELSEAEKAENDIMARRLDIMGL
jgi:hypothetical protein